MYCKATEDYTREYCVALVVDIGVESPPAAGRQNKAGRVLPNLQFVEGDMSEVTIEQGAFVVSVHGGSESRMG